MAEETKQRVNPLTDDEIELAIAVKNALFWKHECQRVNEEAMRNIADLHVEIVELKNELRKAKVKINELTNESKGGMVYA